MTDLSPVCIFRHFFLLPLRQIRLYKSVHMEATATLLHYVNRNGAIHACALYACVSSMLMY